MSGGSALGPVQEFDSMGRMAGALAHDFNNLLTGILGNLELMQLRASRKGITEFDDYLNGSRSAASRAVDLTQRLMAVSGRLALAPEVLKAGDVVADVTEAAADIVPANVTLRADLAADVWPVEADSAQLEESLLQLVSNARAAMPGGGTISISARNVPENFVGFSVVDTGLGMTAETAARAFEPFFTTRHSGAGCGLGLASVMGFARQSGGYAAIEAFAAGRTKVTIFLPRAK